MTMLSLRDTAFALDADAPGAWSLRESLTVPISPRLPAGPVSVRALARRFSAAGTALRSLAGGSTNVWKHIGRGTIVAELRDRLRNPMIIDQNPTGLCGPLSIVMELARRRPDRYVLAAKELLEKGKLTCPTGRVIVAQEELRQEPVLAGNLGQVDWLLAATMRDDENIWDDVDDDANGIESMTFWNEQMEWVRDVLGLANYAYETCFSYGEINCMKRAETAVKAGGVAFFLVDANLLREGGSDSEEDMQWTCSVHLARRNPVPVPGHHSMDDDFPPDHWIVYLGGLNLGDNPKDSDKVSIRLWSWAGEYVVTGTVGAFSEYLWGVVTGR